jgi:hypothetical protein
MLKLARQGALSKPWRRRRQGPTCIREQVNNWPRSIRERDRAEPGPTCFGPGLRPPFALGASLSIASASTGRHTYPFIRESPRRWRSTGRKLWHPRFVINLNHRSTLLTVVKSRSTWVFTSKPSPTNSNDTIGQVDTHVGSTHGQSLGQTPLKP